MFWQNWFGQRSTNGKPFTVKVEISGDICRLVLAGFWQPSNQAVVRQFSQALKKISRSTWQNLEIDCCSLKPDNGELFKTDFIAELVELAKLANYRQNGSYHASSWRIFSRSPKQLKVIGMSKLAGYFAPHLSFTEDPSAPVVIHLPVDFLLAQTTPKI